MNNFITTVGQSGSWFCCYDYKPIVFHCYRLDETLSKASTVYILKISVITIEQKDIMHWQILFVRIYLYVFEALKLCSIIEL